MLTQTAAGRTYDFSHSMGRGSQSGMGFAQPVAAALGENDMVYVLNRGSESIGNMAWNRIGIGARVSQVTVGTQPGDEEFVGEFSKYGNNDGEFIWGSGVAVDGQENIYVSDEWLNQVSVFDKDGKFLRKWSSLGEEDGQEHATSSIAMDSDENIYVTDGRSHQVRKFTRDGAFITSWGKLGSGDGELNAPWGITVDREGYVYVADHRNHRVQKFTSDGQWVSQIGSAGVGRGQLNLPVSVAVDPQGDVYVCDWSSNGVQVGRVHIFDKDGKFLLALDGDAQQLSKWAQMTVEANADYVKRRREVPTTEPEWRFAAPTAVVYDDEKNRILVVDTQRSRLQIYNKVGDYMVPQMNL